jgi:hypothetical protein
VHHRPRSEPHLHRGAQGLQVSAAARTARAHTYVQVSVSAASAAAARTCVAFSLGLR